MQEVQQTGVRQTEVRPAPPGWNGVAQVILAQWQREADESPAEDSSLADEWPESVREFVERAAEVPTSLRRQFLLALRRRIDVLPFEWVHASWLAAVLPEDPLLRVWALSSFPRHIRRQVSRALDGRPASLGFWLAEQPAWFAEWWRCELPKRLQYPARPPVSMSSERPLDYLYRLAPEELERLLRTFGLRSLAAALRGLDPDAVVGLVVALPRVTRARLTEISKNADLPAVDPWFEQLNGLLQRSTVTEDLPLWLAIEDLAVQARATRQDDAAMRLAFRLPYEFGSRLAQRLEFGNDALVHAQPEEWQQTLRSDLADLIRIGLVVPPDLDSEAWP